ncbi:aspartate-semialdehyde dehydrogenase, partial [Anaerovibrio slackiae]|uniref:aspartate-semialdehyde dehydrogenase n=1 Tax=Anaerovibrio slackiae TaxID=2652309 RepID=UPI00386B8CB8
MKKYNVAILGATGAVGQEFLNLIEERNFPFAELKLLASKRSAGKKIQFMGKEYTVEEATDASFEGVDIALFAGGAASKTFAPAAVKAGAVVIDNSSAFRMDPEVPLVVPEVNPEAIASHKGIIANPNCSTIIMVMALKPLYDVSKIKRIVVSTYQAVSGGGKEAMAELEEQVKAINEGREVVANILPGASLAKHYQIAFNLIAQIDVFKENLYTKEEMKMIDETKKIMSDDSLRITATTVRVPVYRSHAESVNVEFEDEVSVEKAREVLAA